MSIPPYKDFIEPVLRFLSAHAEPVDSGKAHDAAADSLQISAEGRTLRVESGTPTYKSRAAWAFNALKHAGLSTSPSLGVWTLTERGREVAAQSAKLTVEQINEVLASARRTKRAQTAPAPRRLVPPSVRRASADARKAYRLPPKPLAIGGQAEVFLATRKTDGATVIFKRAKGPQSEERMRREIEVQRALKHPHIMPILDWDRDAYSWYVMPKGSRSMADLTPPLDDCLLCSIVDAVAAALEFAHKSGHQHRDVKPNNIIDLAGAPGEPHWVLADWGMVRRPLGETTTGLTRSGHFLGTEGFAPPEAYRDAHLWSEEGDIYSLGQLIAWAKGYSPVPNMSATAPQPWDTLVQKMTRQAIGERPRSISEISTHLASIQRVVAPR